MNVLLAEDERSIRLTLGDDLEDAGHSVTAVADGKEALEQLAKGRFDVVITDIRMPGADGITVLDHVAEHAPDTDVILITGVPTYELAVECIKKGAEDFIPKPFNHETVLVKLEQLAERQKIKAENRRMKAELDRPIRFDNLVGRSGKMQEVFETIRQVSDSDVPILLKGESGTGKELFTKAIHQNSNRANKPLVTVACHVSNIETLTDTLFGHVKGAFTGATGERKGKFVEADGGTIFLDDIDDMPMAAQAKLLRVLQEGEVEVMGREEKPVQVDVRIIAATKVDLADLIDEGKFRLDLYYRIQALTIEIPPLRQRPEDIPLLVHHFTKKHGRGEDYELSDEALQLLTSHTWPGNVRELEGATSAAIAFAGKNRQLEPGHFRNLRKTGVFKVDDPVSGAPLVTLKEASEAAEEAHIRKVLDFTEGVTVKAAEILGISRKNLWEKRNKYHIES